jgi:hypothetical protein
MRLGIGELAARLEAFGDDLVRRLAVEHALAAGVVGGSEAAEQPLELLVGPDGDAEHLGADPAIEALHHAVGVRRIGAGMAVLRAEFGTDPGEGGGEATAVVGQHVGEAEGEGGGGLAEEGDGALRRLVVLDGEVHGARAPVDGDVEVALAALAVGGLQLRQALDVDVDEAEVVVPEAALAPLRPVRGGRPPAVDPLCPEDAPDAVAVQVGQEVGDHEGQVVEGEVGGPP